MSKDSQYIQEMVIKAKQVSSQMRILSTRQKNEILKSLKQNILDNIAIIISENKKDLKSGEEKGLSEALLDRLKLSENRIKGIAKGVDDIINLPDPVGGTTDFRVLENGLRIGQASVPLGVVLVIYESRPNVTIDVASLCIKSGNVAIMRGGSEAFYSNKCLYELLKKSFEGLGYAPYVFFVEDTDRELIKALLKQDKYIDIVVPRGGYGLIRNVTENSTIPVIKHDAGICHIYVAEDAPLEDAISISVNAKTQRPGVCNAMETILIDEKFPHIKELLQSFQEEKVLLKGCEKTISMLSGIERAGDQEYATEWLDLILSVKIVKGMSEAIEHIEKYGSGHSEGIISNNYSLIGEFLNRVDASALFVNCSTRFNDGGQFGLGAEVGISTQKLHVRGPMGLEHLTCKKYIVLGTGQIRN